ncbi:hypothetical protein [Methylobrevis albus]|uniref:Uncharacterized protein n=1 Tax=Methylobrevis albus TaxID=2793297 RepID=A0A931I515_9HYPH|nr:hypothetical protein [Methylobrevis albus]MBH0239684.1 hypothetical protein [Methylobrevis albus]
MVSQELIDEIDATLASQTSVRRLARDDELALIENVAAKFIDDKDALWWWTSLKSPSQRHPYQHDGWRAIIGKLTIGSPSAILVVTDDEFPPWPAYIGPIPELLELISETRSFEFMLVGDALAWLLCDCHSNEIVFCGDREDAVEL